MLTDYPVSVVEAASQNPYMTSCGAVMMQFIGDEPGNTELKVAVPVY